MMRRREFIAGLGAAAWPVVARAQRTALPVIGFLGASTMEAIREPIEAFRRGLAETGYVEGQNVAIEYRWAEDDYDRLPALAEELVRRQVALIVTAGNTRLALTAKAATRTIPIVFLIGGNPVTSGLVNSLARPGSLSEARAMENTSHTPTDLTRLTGQSSLRATLVLATLLLNLPKGPICWSPS
jgi:putative ABC transport system substrate-binding protein